MASISYTAVDRNFLVSGHTATTSYYIDFDVVKLDEEMLPMIERSRSMNGESTETNYFGIVWLLHMEAVNLLSSDVDSFKEFFTSCLAGEAFTFDPTGTYAVPGSTVYTCILESFTLAPKRNSPTLAANTRFSLDFSFKIEGTV